MNWVEFSQLKELLMQVNLKLAQQNANDVNNVKEYTTGTLYVNSLVPVFNTLKESDFSDLTYRYVISDSQLEQVKNNLKSLNY